MGIEDAANTDNHHVKLNTPGLYVWVCKLHPYMLGAVIVDDPTTTDGKGGTAYDLGSDLVLLGGPGGTVPFPTVAGNAPTDIALRVLRAFFIVTNPGNWKDYSKADGSATWTPTYPKVPVNLGGVFIPDLNFAMQDYFVTTKHIDGNVIEKQHKPARMASARCGLIPPMSCRPGNLRRPLARRPWCRQPIGTSSGRLRSLNRR